MCLNLTHHQGRRVHLKLNAISSDPLMLEMWSKGQFHHFRTRGFQIWHEF